MKIAQLFEKQDATGLTPDQYKAQELARKQAGAEKYAAKQSATPAPGANVFGGIASQLAGDPNAPTASSTGGTTTPTATGQTHKASATNPNQPQTAPAANAAAPAVDPNASATTPAPAGANGAVTGLANTVGKVSSGVASVAGGVRGAWDAAKSGFQKGRAAVSGQPAPGGAPAPSGAPGGAAAVNNISQIQARLAAVEKAVGIAEGFESKFLGMKI